jgi:hypothetical protein
MSTWLAGRQRGGLGGEVIRGVSSGKAGTDEGHFSMDVSILRWT